MTEGDRYYPGLVIPDRFIITTGSDEERVISEEKDKFFSDILDVLGYEQHAKETLAEVEFYELAFPYQIGVDKTAIQVTDRRIEILFTRGQMIASVLSNRNQGNFWEVGFASYLNPPLVAMLKDEYQRSLDMLSQEDS